MWSISNRVCCFVVRRVVRESTAPLFVRLYGIVRKSLTIMRAFTYTTTRASCSRNKAPRMGHEMMYWCWDLAGGDKGAFDLRRCARLCCFVARGVVGCRSQWVENRNDHITPGSYLHDYMKPSTSAAAVRMSRCWDLG